MKLKIVEVEGKQFAEVKDGNPVYIDDDGKEIAFDAPGTRDTIKRLNSEAKGHREGKEAAEAALKAFEGVDPSKAKEAMEKLSQIDAKKLVEAGDMDAAIQTALKPVQEQLAAAQKEKDTLLGSLNKEVIGNAFGRSKFVTEKLTPAGADLLRTMYASQIKVEEGRPVGYDPNGQKLYSKARPGELADFDEIVESFVDGYAYKDHILKGNSHNGSGKQPGTDGGGSNSKTISRAQFDAMPQSERAGKIREGFKVVDAA